MEKNNRNLKALHSILLHLTPSTLQCLLLWQTWPLLLTSVFFILDYQLESHHLFLFSVLVGWFVWDRVYIAQTGFSLIMQLKITLNLCLSCLNASYTDTSPGHSACLYSAVDIETRWLEHTRHAPYQKRETLVHSISPLYLPRRFWNVQ